MTEQRQKISDFLCSDGFKGLVTFCMYIAADQCNDLSTIIVFIIIV